MIGVVLLYNGNMSRRPKKRTKKYSGEDAKQFNQSTSSEPVVHKYTAVDRGKFGQWWFEKKKLVRGIAIAVGVIVLVIWLIVELVRLVT